MKRQVWIVEVANKGKNNYQAVNRNHYRKYEAIGERIEKKNYLGDLYDYRVTKYVPEEER